MIIFDPKSCEILNSQKEDICILIESSGCNGNALKIKKCEKYEKLDLVKIDSNLSSDITVYIEDLHKKLFKDAYITKVNTKWILKSEKILSRCGCARSFSLKSENERDNKIALLKEKLKKAKKKNVRA